MFDEPINPYGARFDPNGRQYTGPYEACLDWEHTGWAYYCLDDDDVIESGLTMEVALEKAHQRNAECRAWIEEYDRDEVS